MLALSTEQQITLYPHRDTNNDWRIVNASTDGDPYTNWADHDIHYITSGTRVKIRHIQTEKSLHSHDIRPPVSDVDFQQEVSGYGIPGYTGDTNDDWIVEIVKGDKRDKESSKRLRTLRTHFRLRHSQTGCYLFSHKVKLPDWAFEQQEVTCNKQAVLVNSLWYIETNFHPKCRLAFIPSVLHLLTLHSARGCPEGKLQAAKLLLQVLGTPESDVDYQRRFD